VRRRPGRRAEGGRCRARLAGRLGRGRRRRRADLRRVRRDRRAAHRARAAGGEGMTGIPDFGSAELGRAAAQALADDWAKTFEEATGHGVAEATWETPEGIAVPPLYTPADLAGLDFLDTYPGLPP